MVLLKSDARAASGSGAVWHPLSAVDGCFVVLDYVVG